jgi:hypothetical protein
VKKPSRNLKPWTPADKKLMRSLASQRCSARRAAPMLGRTVAAVKWAAMEFGIRFRAINQPQGTQRTRKQRTLLAQVQRRRWARARRARR